MKDTTVQNAWFAPDIPHAWRILHCGFDSKDVDPVLQGRTYDWDDYNIAVPTFAWDAAVGSTCLLLVTISLGFLLWRVLDAIRLKKKW